MASALTSSVGLGTASTGYVGTSSSGESELSAGHSLGSPYSSASAGHIDQTAQIPVAASGSTTFTLALAFDTSESAAVADASASLASGFSAVESSFQSGWHAWNAGLNAPPNSVTGSELTQYEVALMEAKADEDKTYVGGFVAAPSTPRGSSVGADGGTGQSGQHGYHLVWTRDEYEMASALLAAGDTQDASDALSYIFQYEENSSGQVKQNSWLNGNPMWGGNQQDEEADPIILAYQLGRTDAADYTAHIEPLAKFIAANGPNTGQERWEENSGYSPATIAAEISGLITASSIATANGDTANASSWLALAKTWASDLAGWTYTVTAAKVTSVSLSWSGNPEATGYQVYRSTAGATPTLVTTTTKNAYTDTGLAPSTAYTYYVVAVNGYGSSPNSASVSTTTLAPGTPPNAPTGLTASSTGMTTTALSWTAATDTNGTVAGYNVYRATGTGTAALAGSSTGTSYNDSGLSASTTYHYYVTALDADGNESAASNTASVTTDAAPVVPVISAISPTSAAAGTQVTVSGTGFGSSQGSSYLLFSDSGTNWGAPPDTATFQLNSWSNTAITFTVPTPSGSSGQFKVVPGTTATISVTDSVGTSNTANLAITSGTSANAPTITSVSPTSAAAGTQVTVIGTGFGASQGSSYLLFSDSGTNWGAPGDTATFTLNSWSATAITFTVPTPSGSSGQFKVVPGTTAAISVTVAGQASNTENLPITSSASPPPTGSVTETFNVTVPSSTPSGAKVYLAGNLSVLGEGQADWAANGVLMTQVSPTLWTVTLTAAAPATLQYKYTLNGNWSNNEETSSCAYVGNRSANVNNGTESDTVASWEGYGGC